METIITFMANGVGEEEVSRGRVPRKLPVIPGEKASLQVGACYMAQELQGFWTVVRPATEQDFSRHGISHLTVK